MADPKPRPGEEPPGAHAEWRDVWRLMRAKARELVPLCFDPEQFHELAQAVGLMSKYDPDTPGRDECRAAEGG